MEVEIEITECCTKYSCTINGIEYGELIDKESKYYNPNFVYKVLETMAKELYKQEEYNIKFTILLDGILSFIKLENSHWFFERLFQFNNNKKITVINNSIITTKELNIKDE